MVAAVACVSATDMDEQQHSRTFSVMLPSVQVNSHHISGPGVCSLASHS